MKKHLFLCLLYALMVAGILALTGCASAPRTVTETALVVQPCIDNKTLPEPPARGLELDASKPGEAVQAVLANRLRWIGYGDALREQLESCK